MMIITMLLKTIPTARGAQSLQRMDSACLFLLFKLLGKVFRTMTITKGLWGRATLTMDQKFEIGTPLMRNFLPFFFLFCRLPYRCVNIVLELPFKYIGMRNKIFCVIYKITTRWHIMTKSLFCLHF